MSPSLFAVVMHGSGRYYLDPLLATGRLPNVARIMAEGHHRYVTSALPLAAGAWVTMLTGESVGVHGVFDYVELDARRYDGMAGRHASSADYADRTIHTIMSRAGRRVASIYLPMTSPPWPIDGMLISGFPLPDERHPPTYPPELADTLPSFGTEKLLSLRYAERERIDKYLRVNLERIEALTAATLADRYDVVMSCIPTPDLAHHYFWKPGDAAALEEIYGYYDLVDRAIGRLVEQLGRDSTVVVLSDHGGRAAPARLFGVNTWLAEAGYLSISRSVFARPAVITAANGVVNWAKKMRLNHALAGRIRGSLRRRVSAVTHNTAFVDWSRSRAYGLDFVCPLAGIEINLRGRQDHGVVDERDYESLRQEIIDKLGDSRDAETGRRLFTNVRRREEMFHGPHVERVPDIIGVLTSEYDVKGHLDLPAAGPNPGQWDYPFMGYHGEDAFFAARGPGIRPGMTPALGRMIDIAPTLLALAGVERPSWMEGRAFEF